MEHENQYLAPKKIMGFHKDNQNPTTTVITHECTPPRDNVEFDPVENTISILTNSSLQLGNVLLFENIIIPWCQDILINGPAITNVVFDLTKWKILYVDCLEIQMKMVRDIITIYHGIIDYESYIGSSKENIRMFYASFGAKNYKDYENYQYLSIRYTSYSIFDYILKETLDCRDLTFPCLSFRIKSLLKFLNEGRVQFEKSVCDMPVIEMIDHFSSIFSVSHTILLIAFTDEFVDEEWVCSQDKFNRSSKSVKYTKGAEKRMIELFPKNMGRHFGCIIEDKKWENDHLISCSKYYIKCHRFYKCKTIAKNSNDFVNKSSQKYFGSISNQSLLGLNHEHEHDHLNLCELLGYDLLSRIGIGPKVHFLIVDNLRYGIFIATEEVKGEPRYSDISYFDTNIENMKESGSKSEDKKQGITLIDFNSSDKEHIVSNEDRIKKIRDFMLESHEMKQYITLVDLITRIFYLSDMNTNNFGVLYDDSNIESIVIKGVKIIDFWIQSVIENFNEPNNNEEISEFENDFLINFTSSNTIISYSTNSVTYEVLNSTLDKCHDYIMKKYIISENKLVRNIHQVPKGFVSSYKNDIAEAENKKNEEGRIAFQILCQDILKYNNGKNAISGNEFDILKQILADSKSRITSIISDSYMRKHPSIKFYVSSTDQSLGIKSLNFYCERVCRMFELFYNEFSKAKN